MTHGLIIKLCLKTACIKAPVTGGHTLTTGFQVVECSSYSNCVPEYTSRTLIMLFFFF